MTLIGTTKSDTFLMLQFEPNESEKKQLAKALECPVKDFEESWFNVGQFKSDGKMLDCIQVGTVAWGSECDMTLDEFSEDFLTDIQNFLTECFHTDLSDKIGTTVELRIA